MSDIDADVLWLMFGYIGTTWGTAPFCDMPQSQFQQAISGQVQRDRQYAGYYRAAVAEYRALLHQYGSRETARRALFQDNQLPKPKLPDVASYVLLEFMRWNVAFGGFRAFNYENYNGWMGGGSFLKTPPPYRAVPSSAQASAGAGVALGGDEPSTR